MVEYLKIQELLQEKADCNARLKQIPYDGTPEIKENSSGKYLYVRKRIAGKLISEYVDKYSDDLYKLLLDNSKQARELKKSIRKIDKELAKLGYEQGELSSNVIKNIDFARSNLKINIYAQAVLEGVATSFPQTENIIDNGVVNGVTTSDIQKILNLKHAWELILDIDVIQAKTDYYLLCHIAKLINEGFYSNGGRIRNVPVSIGKSSYKPPLPIESVVKERILEITSQKKDIVDIAIDLCLYCMKTQVFIDGNKRASIIFANHFLIKNGKGLLVIPENLVETFKNKLLDFYEGKDTKKIFDFLKNKCFRDMK